MNANNAAKAMLLALATYCPAMTTYGHPARILVSTTLFNSYNFQRNEVSI